MKIKVVLLDGVEEFLDTLPVKLEAKAYWTMALLQQQGARLKEPYCKPIKGDKGLFELRVKFASDIVRLFYFQHNRAIYVVTSGYIKKSQKLNKLEIEKAVRLKNKYQRRISNDKIK